MNKDYAELAKILEELAQAVERLSQSQTEIAAAGRAKDLAALSECMKTEQAYALTLRNLDKKRQDMQTQMGIGSHTLQMVRSTAPDEESRTLIRQAEEKLSANYKMLQSASEIARSTLECNLHEVEKLIENLGVDPKMALENPTQGGAHTDFHA